MTGVPAWLGGIWAALMALLPGGGAPAAPGFAGYVESNYVYVAPQSTGPIARLAVADGTPVKAGQLLFQQTDAQLKALADAADAQAAEAKANWQNLTTGGRAEELAASQAAVNKAQADLKLAQTTFARSQVLLQSNTITQAQLDQDNASVQSAQAALNQAEAQLAVTSLPAREEQQKAAEASYDAALAGAAKAHADLADRTVVSPVDGRVEKTYFDPGETAPAGTPVVSILPTEALKVEFYVSEPVRPQLSMGQRVAVSCDGCGDLTGTVSSLASDPQYTSPLIYSRDERSQMVFLVEATLAPGSAVLPGQPVTVTLAP